MDASTRRATRIAFLVGCIAAAAILVVWALAGRGGDRAERTTPTTAAGPSVPTVPGDVRKGVGVTDWTPVRWLGVLALPVATRTGATDLSGPRDGDSDWRGALARLDDPALSDLGGAEGAAAAQVARNVLTADIAGVGREAFPYYFRSMPADRPCPGFAVLGAGADTLPSNGPGTFAVALVVWAGSCPESSGAPVTSRVYLQRQGTAWQPVTPTAIS